MLNEQLLQQLRAMSVSLVAEALNELGLKLVFASGFRPVSEERLLVGTAVTLRMASVDQERRGGYSLFTAAMDAAQSVCAPVIVIQSPDIEGATWDAVHAVAARQRGVQGLVIDGAARDVDELRAMGFPVFASRVSPWAAGRTVDTVSANEPIRIGGEEVDAGDIVLADPNGLVVVPCGNLERVVERAAQHKAQRDAIRQGLESGTSYDDSLRPPGD